MFFFVMIGRPPVSTQGRSSAAADVYKRQDVDFGAIARAFGAGGERVERPDEVGPVVRRALEQDGPVVVEAVIDAHEKFPLTSRATAMKDSVGLPRVIDSLSVESVRALFKMFRDKEK